MSSQTSIGRVSNFSDFQLFTEGGEKRSMSTSVMADVHEKELSCVEVEFTEELSFASKQRAQVIFLDQVQLVSLQTRLTCISKLSRISCEGTVGTRCHGESLLNMKS